LKPLAEIPAPFVNKIERIKKPGEDEFIHYSQAFEYGNTLKGNLFNPFPTYSNPF